MHTHTIKKLLKFNKLILQYYIGAICMCFIVCAYVCVHDCVCVLLSMGHVPDNKLIGLDYNVYIYSTYSGLTVWYPIWAIK